LVADRRLSSPDTKAGGAFGPSAERFPFPDGYLKRAGGEGFHDSVR
jgi:hypothetical protein